MDRPGRVTLVSGSVCWVSGPDVWDLLLTVDRLFMIPVLQNVAPPPAALQDLTGLSLGTSDDLMLVASNLPQLPLQPQLPRPPGDHRDSGTGKLNWLAVCLPVLLPVVAGSSASWTLTP